MDTVLLALVKIGKNDEVKKYTVPMHPEYIFVEALGQNEWHAQNKKTKEFVTVVKKEKGDFVEFAISGI